MLCQITDAVLYSVYQMDIKGNPELLRGSDTKRKESKIFQRRW